MKSNYKAFVLFGVLFAFVLLVSSVVAAETSQDKNKVDEEAKESVNQQGRPGGGKSCRWQGGCCRWSPKGYGCMLCCNSQSDSAANEAEETDGQVNGGDGSGGWGGGGHGGGHCKHGCCGKWKGGCSYCCADAEEARAYDMASQGLTNP